MTDNPLIPLDTAAAYLAQQQWDDDTPRDTALAVLKQLQAGPGCYTPAYAVRLLAEHRIQRQIDCLVKARKLPLHDPITFTPTIAAANALVRQSDLTDLLIAGAHLKANDGTEDSRHARELTSHWSATAEFEQRQIELHEAGHREPLCLYEWFKHDTWTVNDAMLLLIGLEPTRDCMLLQAEDPDGTADRIISARHLSGTLVDIDGWRNANVTKDIVSRDPNSPLYEMPITSIDLIRFSASRHLMMKVWRSGDHRDRNPPGYYIEWALSKGYDIPWLEWAKQKKLVGMQGNRSLDLAPIGAPAESELQVEESEDWRVNARKIADECFDQDTSHRVRDSLAKKNASGQIVGGYSYRVMEIMQARSIHGPRGLIDNPATIAREALQGKKWWSTKEK